MQLFINRAVYLIDHKVRIYTQLSHHWYYASLPYRMAFLLTRHWVKRST